MSMETVPSAERVQVSVGRKVNGVEQRILNINIYKRDASETRVTMLLLNRGMDILSVLTTAV